MIAGNFTLSARDAWVMVPGHTIENTYDSNNNMIKSVFKDGNNIIFVQNFTYDNNNNCTLITCTNQ